jgi:hypothetical protein
MAVGGIYHKNEVQSCEPTMHVVEDLTIRNSGLKVVFQMHLLAG